MAITDCRPYNDMTNRPLNRHLLLRVSARMFCPDPACKTLRAVADFFQGVTAMSA
jgi:hypothetical protein